MFHFQNFDLVITLKIEFCLKENEKKHFSGVEGETVGTVVAAIFRIVS